MRFVFEHGEGIEVQFENNNDTTAVVEIQNLTMGGLVVRNCLWADGEDNETALFGVVEELAVSVFLGEGDFWHWMCVKGLDELLGNFPLCAETEIIVESR